MKQKKILQKNKKENFLKREYSLAWKFLKESRKFVYAVAWIFLAFFIVGFLIPVPSVLQNEILKFLKDIVAQVQGMSLFGTIKFILLNNVQSSFLGMVLGFFFGIFSILVAVINGYLLGYVASLSVASEGFGSLWKILPHGIFELPAVFISLGLGIKFGTFLLKKEKGKYFRDYFWNCFRIFVLIVIPLLIVAAIIEGSLIFFLK